MANFKKLQLSLILRVAGQIWQILQISAVICRILQIPRGFANSKPNIQKKNLQKSAPKKSYNLACEGWAGSGGERIFLGKCRKF